MIALLAGSAVVFWLVLGVITTTLFVAVDRDNGVIATCTLIITAIFAWFIYDFNIITWVLTNINTVLMYLAGYFVVSVLWAKAKWALFIRAMLRQMKFEGYTNGRFEFRNKLQHVPARASENKESIMMWMMYWPISMTWTIINDPVRRAFNALYEMIANSFQNDSNEVFKDYVKKKDNES